MSCDGVSATSVRFRTTQEAQDGKHGRRRSGTALRATLSKVGRPTLQSLYENALIVQVRAVPDSTRHITDKTVPNGWMRGMSVFADVHEVSASAGHAVIEEHEQEHELAAAEPPHKKLRTRVARRHVRWFLSFADRLHVHGWRKKDVFMNCQRWCPEIFGKVHADTVYRWKLESPRRSVGVVAEKLTVLTHDMLRQGSCVSLEIMRTLFQDVCKKEGLEVTLSRESLHAFLVSIDLSCKAAAQRTATRCGLRLTRWC